MGAANIAEEHHKVRSQKHLILGNPNNEQFHS